MLSLLLSLSLICCGSGRPLHSTSLQEVNIVVRRRYNLTQFVYSFLNFPRRSRALLILLGSWHFIGIPIVLLYTLGRIIDLARYLRLAPVPQSHAV